MIASRLEFAVLLAVAGSPTGASLGDIRARFENAPVARVLDHLENKGQLDRFPGCVYAVTPLGLSRIRGAAS